MENIILIGIKPNKIEIFIRFSLHMHSTRYALSETRNLFSELVGLLVSIIYNAVDVTKSIPRTSIVGGKSYVSSVNKSK